MSFQYKALDLTDKEIFKISELLSYVYKDSHKFNFRYLDWLYRENPEGNAIGYNAYTSDNTLAAHYAVIPIKALLFGKVTRCLLSLNTATAPEAQGKGLFKKLANMSYADGKNLGFEAVIGVPNTNSTHGFIHSLGFTLVSQLDVRLSFGLPTIKKEDHEIDLKYFYDEENINWRLSNPNRLYYSRSNQDSSLIFADIGFPLRVILSVAHIDEVFRQTNLSDKHGFRLFLWIGKGESFNWDGVMNIPIPKILRPSPLNFIFKDLTKERTLSRDRIHFQAIDFDAY